MIGSWVSLLWATVSLCFPLLSLSLRDLVGRSSSAGCCRHGGPRSATILEETQGCPCMRYAHIVFPIDTAIFRWSGVPMMNRKTQHGPLMRTNFLQKKYGFQITFCVSEVVTTWHCKQCKHPAIRICWSFRDHRKLPTQRVAAVATSLRARSSKFQVGSRALEVASGGKCVRFFGVSQVASSPKFAAVSLSKMMSWKIV